jgi:transposase
MSNVEMKLRERYLILDCHLDGMTVYSCHNHCRKVLGKFTPSLSTVKRWYRKFQWGNYDVTVKTTKGKKKMNKNVKKVKSIITKNKYISIKRISSFSSIPKTTVQRIIKTELKLKVRNIQKIPHFLNSSQKKKKD